jgi:hypothetical protein
LVKRVLGDHPTATPSELLWCYAIERDRPHLAGRKPKWTTTFKALLALEVDVALAARGEIATTKNLPLIFEEMQKAWPARYRGLSWKRLLALYYEGRREGRRIGSPSGQFGNSAE